MTKLGILSNIFLAYPPPQPQSSPPPPAPFQPQQPAGGPPPPPPQSEPPKKKGKGKGLLIVGIILLILGLVLAIALLPLTVMNTDDAEDEIKDMEKGDSVTFYGEITNVEEVDLAEMTGGMMTGKYYYNEFDGNGKMDADEDDLILPTTESIGSEGDTVVVEVTLKADPGTVEDLSEAIEVKSTSAFLYQLPGIIILIVGVILLLVGFVKMRKAKKAQAAPPPPAPAPPQQPPQY